MKSKFFDFLTEDYSSLSVSQLKRMADYWLRQHLLYNSKRNGYNQIYCPLKNQFYNESNMQASHFIDRATMSTRYDLDNVWLISSQSNTWDAQVSEEGYKSKHHKDFEDFLIEKIGTKKLNNLLDRSNIITIFAKEDYIEVIENFRKDVR